MIRNAVVLLAICVAAACACCSSQPEGPATKQFLDSLTYGVKVGDTRVDTFEVSASTVHVPFGIGGSSLLRIGEIQGIVFEAILLSIDLSESEHAGKPVSRAILSLPVRVADTTLTVRCHELLHSFEDGDTIAAVPPYDPAAVPDSLGGTERRVGLDDKEQSFDTTLARQWFEDGRERLDLALVWHDERDPSGFIEMHAREYGSEPVLLRVDFADGTADTFPVAADYSVASFEVEGLDAVGGVATRIHFTFDLGDLDERAMIHSSSLVLTVKGDVGLGVTPGESIILSLGSDFYYYLYTPGSSNPSSSEFLGGVEVDIGQIDPAETRILKMPLRGFTADVAQGIRANTGLVLQSDLETVRLQRASFYEADNDTIVGPYIEVIYSLPADFVGGP
jgi:hypothetical protein